jgi:hypothetical protein
MVDQVVSFIADKPVRTLAPDAWPRQAYLSYRIRTLITIVLGLAGVVAAVYVFIWLEAWADWSFALGFTAFLSGMMPARHYFARTHPALGRWSARLWVVVLAFALVAAAIMTTPRETETPSAIEHEQELFNARNYPPRYKVEAMRAYAIQFCPEYERWFTYLVPWHACWDARKFDGWLTEINHYRVNDRKLIQWDRHPPQPPVILWWPGWSYIAREAHMLPMRLLIVLISAVAFWGAVEMQNVILVERPGTESTFMAAPSVPNIPPIATQTETEGAFEAWALEYIKRDSNTDTPTELFRIAYRLVCMSKGWPEYNADAFSRKLTSWARDKLRTFERENTRKVRVYIGLTLKDDPITQEARRSFENGT